MLCLCVFGEGRGAVMRFAVAVGFKRTLGGGRRRLWGPAWG